MSIESNLVNMHNWTQFNKKVIIFRPPASECVQTLFIARIGHTKALPIVFGTDHVYYSV